MTLAAHGHNLWSGLSAWDWVVFGAESVVFVWSLWLAIRWTLSPGEENADHVKRSILDEGDPVLANAFPAGGSSGSPSPGAPKPSETRS